MRVLTDPAETGAVTLALPQDVQAEAHDWPEDLFSERVWYVPRPLPERVKLNIILVQNQGFGSIGALSESVGSQRFGTSYRYRDAATGLLDGGVLPVDLAANAASLGADVLKTATVKEFTEALGRARASDRTTVVYIETDPLAPVPSSESWWDVPVSDTSALASTQKPRPPYKAPKPHPRLYL